jgi:hypothetical protein
MLSACSHIHSLLLLIRCETAKDVDYALLLKQVFDDVLNAQLKDGLLTK